MHNPSGRLLLMFTAFYFQWSECGCWEWGLGWKDTRYEGVHERIRFLGVQEADGEARMLDGTRTLEFLKVLQSVRGICLGVELRQCVLIDPALQAATLSLRPPDKRGQSSKSASHSQHALGTRCLSVLPQIGGAYTHHRTLWKHHITKWRAKVYYNTLRSLGSLL